MAVDWLTQSPEKRRACLNIGQGAAIMTGFVIGRSGGRAIKGGRPFRPWDTQAVMAQYGKMAGAAAAVSLALLAATLLRAAPDAARWALLICSLGFVGATIRLHRLDTRF